MPIPRRLEGRSAIVTGQLVSVDGGIASHAPTFADTRRMLGESG